MSLDISEVENMRSELQKYYEIGPIKALTILNQLSKRKLEREILVGSRITQTIATLSKKLANSDDEDDVEVSELCSKLTCKWKRIFEKKRQ
ncbi:TFIIS helical bundle-like domain protein (macronuclear) [Tetrahymena thermophila SB210]|uniref:TFIIS helical bundle-like domain protein n=1 Tax=Tetrahymena thermophila (strain SB210) TaxID=312017 RepID=Q22BD3_TETTS|nr:TFIIS helical bundle-like domain protein [Tetrahymena thermophila SB210]EAR82575.1 TFIIS helical bundle-like domain protein [Tetrahymena thermophila SB210]|eukprot:XP_001030238.1 TFIIS helical bundle-like domain protein [Tetrahymena thermophila SB210]